MTYTGILALLQEEQQQNLVRIIGTETANGDDLYKTYPWFKRFFPDPNYITGVVRGRSGSPILDTGIIIVQFAVIENGVIVDKAGHSNNFRPDQLEEI